MDEPRIRKPSPDRRRAVPGFRQHGQWAHAPSSARVPLRLPGHASMGPACRGSVGGGVSGSCSGKPHGIRAKRRRSSARVWTLRESIFRVFNALGAGSRVDENDLEHLGAIWQVGQAHLRLFHSVDGFSLGWDDEPSLERLARRVAASAIHLLTSPQMHQVRICSGEHCDWLFIDTSPQPSAALVLDGRVRQPHQDAAPVHKAKAHRDRRVSFCSGVLL